MCNQSGFISRRGNDTRAVVHHHLRRKGEDKPTSYIADVPRCCISTAPAAAASDIIYLCASVYIYGSARGTCLTTTPVDCSLLSWPATPSNHSSLFFSAASMMLHLLVFLSYASRLISRDKPFPSTLMNMMLYAIIHAVAR